MSLVIPAHNEAQRLPATLLHYHRDFAARYQEDFEMLVVCNGCTDDTPAIAAHLMGRLSQLRTLVIPQAVGKGGAVLAGFTSARGREVVFADADAATASASLFALLDELAHHDVVIGSRRLKASIIVKRQPALRRILGAAFMQVVRTLFNLPFHDTQCGAKALRQGAAAQLVGRVTERRWTFDVDLLLHARQLGLNVHEAPVTWADHAGSQLRLGPTLTQVIGSLWRMSRVHPRPGRRTARFASCAEGMET